MYAREASPIARATWEVLHRKRVTEDGVAEMSTTGQRDKNKMHVEWVGLFYEPPFLPRMKGHGSF